eukprot:9468502-Pyramimonas_sp.AAC.1
MIAKGHVDIGQFVDDFSAARDTKHIISELGLQRHPWLALVASGDPSHLAKSWVRHAFLSKALYHATLEDLFASTAEPDQYDKKKKQRRQYLDSKASLLDGPRAPEYDTIMVRAMHSHFLATMVPGSTYAMPIGSAEFNTVEGILGQPRSKDAMRAEGAIVPAGADEIAALDVVDGVDRPDNNYIFFQVLFTGLGRKKMPRVAPGAGGKLHQSSTAIAVHPVRTNARDAFPVLAKAASAAGFDDCPTFIMGYLLGDPNSLEEQ